MSAWRAPKIIFTFRGVKITAEPKPKNHPFFCRKQNLYRAPSPARPPGKVVFSQSAKTEIVYQQLPATFSFSALKAFENCPLQYKYQYYLKLPSPGSPYFSFGQTIHKVFELYLKDYQTRKNQNQQDLFSKKDGKAALGDFKLLENLYQQNWVDEWYTNKKQKEDYRKKGKELLKNFYDHLADHPPDPKYLEKSFYLPLGNYKFTGKIDRADISDGGLEIIDYKTSAKIPSKNDKDDLDQLRIYQWAAQEYLGEKVNNMCYWYLQDNKFLPEAVASKEEIEDLKKKLLTTIETIVETIKYDRFKELHQQTKEHKCVYEDLE